MKTRWSLGLSPLWNSANQRTSSHPSSLSHRRSTFSTFTIWSLLLSLFCLVVPSLSHSLPFLNQRVAGGAGGVLQANVATQTLLGDARIKGAVEQQLERQVEMFRVISYSTQTVAGTNYFAKVQIASNPNEYIHIRVYHQSWTNTLELTSMQTDKTVDDAVVYF